MQGLYMASVPIDPIKTAFFQASHFTVVTLLVFTIWVSKWKNVSFQYRCWHLSTLLILHLHLVLPKYTLCAKIMS